MATLAASMFLGSTPGQILSSSVLAMVVYLLFAVAFMHSASPSDCQESGNKKYQRVLLMQLPFYCLLTYFIYEKLSGSNAAMFASFL